MASNAIKPLRCAIYTRKSTEHGLEQEFNSLDAQRDACEAYIKSQASQGWKALPQHYDDPAYSGGNLDRPALQQLLKDIDAGRIDVIVVYKIDRLTRSLADFAKLVEAFDAKSISFVAVTQQFNTTTSMGRLTLNVLLSFAQFERELSSERVRDKIAASRRKGKWTGGTVPLGYDAKDKKLVINKAEAETVRYIFRRYLELKSFRQAGRGSRQQGHRHQTPEHQGQEIQRRHSVHLRSPRLLPQKPALHRRDRPQGQMVSRASTPPSSTERPSIRFSSFSHPTPPTETPRDRRATRCCWASSIDDRGNRMSPSYSTKNGVRYRFYVSSALLRGRKTEAGSVARVAAAEIERVVLAALEQHRDGRQVKPNPCLSRQSSASLLPPTNY